MDVSNKKKSMVPPNSEKAEKRKAEAPKESPDDAAKKAGLVYRSFSVNKANAWLKDLQTPNAKKKLPSAEQLSCLEEVIKRCEFESRESNQNKEFRSEPLRMLLHGVPGAMLNASRISEYK